MDKNKLNKPKKCPFCGGSFIVYNYYRYKWQCQGCKNLLVSPKEQEDSDCPKTSLYHSYRYEHKRLVPHDDSSKPRYPKWLAPLSIAVILFLLSFTAYIFATGNDSEPDGISSQENDQSPPNIFSTSNSVRHFTNVQPPYSKDTSGSKIELINNPYASDPTWQHLINFITQDLTDKNPYIDSLYQCGSFAEDVHNNAEKFGIKSAWVAIDFSDGSIGHACNAFYTVDKGLVFIDSTGSQSDGDFTISFISLENPDNPNASVGSESYDKIAYVELGKEYGMISVGYATSLDYPFYEDYEDKCDNYTKIASSYYEEVDTYNAEVDSYNAELGGRTQLEEPDYSYFRDKYNELVKQKEALEETRSELEVLFSEIGSYFWQPLGVVSNIEIYW